MAQKGKGVGGRPKGSSRKVVNARKVLRTQQDLEESIGKDAVDAYNVIRDVMNDDKAPPASRRAAAGDILAMFSKLYHNSEQRVKEYEENKGIEKDSQESQENDENNVRPLFAYDE